MDLGCIDLGCVPSPEKQSNEASPPSESYVGATVRSCANAGKSRSVKETGQSTQNALNKFTSQIKKPPHRKASPLNWFPRKKVDSYLKRKIKLLQELGGMNSSLDETLGDSNPHYTRVEKEKIAAREAACKAMNARKAAMIEASWCRILQAARIQSKEAEALLLKAEKEAAEAFKAAEVMGVIMYDIPNSSVKPCEIETSSIHREGSTTTHTVAATFETAFEVDKEVTAAVKTAFVRLANCPSNSKDEFKDLLRKISQNPDMNEELPGFYSECESYIGSEVEPLSHSDETEDLNSKLSDIGTEVEPLSQKDENKDLNCRLSVSETRQRKLRKKKSSESINMKKLVEMMLERLKALREEELAKLATIVATCGLNAALAEVENVKQHVQGSAADLNSRLQCIRRMSSVGGRATKISNMEMDRPIGRKQADIGLPSLDKFLVKHMSKLEREVLEAKKTRMSESKKVQKADVENSETFDSQVAEQDSNITSSETATDLGSMLVKQSSKLEKDIKDAKVKWSKPININMNGKKQGGMYDGIVSCTEQDVPEVPSLDKFLVKHVSRLEREVQEAKNKRRQDTVGGSMVTKLKNKVAKTSCHDGREDGKENRDLNKNVDDGETGSGKAVKSLEEILVKPVHRLEKEKLQAGLTVNDNGPQKHRREIEGNNSADCESLDKVLVKHISQLEREKVKCRSSLQEEFVNVKKRDAAKQQAEKNEGGLDQILIKHKPRLEREIDAAQQPEDPMKYSVARRLARERELQEAWGGLSLGNSVRPHLSKLEREKAAWIKAEEDQRRLKV